MTWITDHAPAPADLDACINCGLCMPVCPTYQLTRDETASPRGRLAAVAAVGSGEAEIDDRFSEIVDFCLQCRACETACPSMVPFGVIIEGAVAEVVARKASAVRRLAVTTAVNTPALLKSGSIAIGLAQRVGIPSRGLRKLPIPVPSARGGSWGVADDGHPTATLLVGCVADAWFSPIHKSTIEVLLAAGYHVDAPRNQSCCGALAAHDGFMDAAAGMGERNREAFGDADLIVVDVAGCGAHLKADSVLGSRVKDVTEVVAAAISEGKLPTLPALGQRIAVQDPCHLEHGQGIVEQPRDVLKAAGYEVVDADPGGLCCGAAGTYQLDHPDVSAELGRRKAAALQGTGTHLVASANAGCEMQLRSFLDRGYEVKHPVEWYAARLSESNS